MRARWLFLGLALLTAAICVRLGAWQLARHQRRALETAAAREARARPVVDYPTRPMADGSPVQLTGTFDHTREFVLRGRAYNGAPGVEIATPLRVAGSDSAVIVLRGFVPSDDAVSVDRGALAEPGVRTVRGIAFPVPKVGVPLTRNGEVTWDRIPGTYIRVNFPYPVATLGVWQEKDSTTTGLPIRMGAPTLSGGPHLSYAIQWFAFALIFAGGGFAYTYRKREERTHIISSAGLDPTDEAHSDGA